MTPLAVFVRTLMKTSALFLGASWIVLHPSLDWSSRSAAVTAGLAPREAALAGLRYALADQDPAVRGQAAAALAKIRSGRPAFGDPVRQTRSVKELVTDLTDGDLKFTTDFRSVYATLLEKWLEIPSEGVLGGKFETLGFV